MLKEIRVGNGAISIQKDLFKKRLEVSVIIDTGIIKEAFFSTLIITLGIQNEKYRPNSSAY